MCIDSLPTCKSVYHLHAWCLQRPEEGVSFSGTGVEKVVSCSVSSGRAASALNSEPSLQPQCIALISVCLWQDERQRLENSWKSVGHLAWRIQ